VHAGAREAVNCGGMAADRGARGAEGHVAESPSSGCAASSLRFDPSGDCVPAARQMAVPVALVSGEASRPLCSPKRHGSQNAIGEHDDGARVGLGGEHPYCSVVYSDL
jgi:hypothetical protein